MGGPKEEPPPAAALSGRDAVVHLIGETIAQRWSDEAKREIRESRVLGTRNLVAGLRALPEPSARACSSRSRRRLLRARGDEPLDESAPPGDDFVARMVVDWEAEASAAAELGVRVALTRTGPVLSEGGALGKMLPFFKLGLGGPGRRREPVLPLGPPGRHRRRAAVRASTTRPRVGR